MVSTKYTLGTDIGGIPPIIEVAQLASLPPENPIYHYDLDIELERTGHIDSARRSCQAALKLKPGYPEVEQALKTLGG
jgi:hypothetical protein